MARKTTMQSVADESSPTPDENAASNLNEESIQNPAGDSASAEEASPKVKPSAAEIADKVVGCFGKVDGFIEKILGVVENHPWENWFAAANAFIGKYIPVIIGLSGAVAFVTGLVTAIRNDFPFSLVVANFGILIAAFFSMNLAPKALTLTNSFLSTREADSMRPELLYILKVVLGLGGYIATIWLLFQFDKQALIAAVVTAVLSTLAIIVFSHPAIVGAKADSGMNAVEETIAILLFLPKLLVALLTIVVGLSTVLLFLLGIIGIFSDEIEPVSILSIAAIAPVLVPVAVYVAYLTTVFIFDLYRAVVSLPRKLDDIRAAIQKKK